jgi:hypothetical protein
MKRSDKSNINERLRTSFANSGRAAGIGISYDRYDEESGYRPGPKHIGCTFPSDSLTPQQLSALNSEVRVYKMKKGMLKDEQTAETEGN